jgi:MoxR-like ATPase
MAKTLLHSDIVALNERIREESVFVDRIVSEVGRVIVGQRHMIERLLIGLMTGGHVLLEGVPGLAKTLTVSTLAKTIHASFSRIQFTPDLLPADVIGTMIYNQRTGEFTPKKGPIFANIVLADEINRAPAKVQSAMLEAMQEHQVTIGDHTYPLDDPFLVLATQNPIEQEGTYPLPEAQIDRFMLKISVTYPNKEEERAIIDRMTSGIDLTVDRVVHPDDIVRARSVVSEVHVDEKIKDYIVNLVFATRDPKSYGLHRVMDGNGRPIDLSALIEYGASPRASIYLTMASKAHAFIRHRGYVTPDDVKSVAMDILRHRVIVTYEAEAEEMSSEDIVRRVLDNIEVP